MKAIIQPSKQPLEPRVSVETFIALVKSGIELWTQAGEILVSLVAQNPNVYSEIIARNPAITFEMLLAFERMGRKQIYPPLLMDSSPAAKRLIELPYEVQERYCREPIEVVVKAVNGCEPQIQKKYLKELSGYEAQTVFATDRVKTIEEQKAFVKSHDKPGRKATKSTTKKHGVFCLKMSPSGALVAERVTDSTLATPIKLYERDGVKQCMVALMD